MQRRARRPRPCSDDEADGTLDFEEVTGLEAQRAGSDMLDAGVPATAIGLDRCRVFDDQLEPVGKFRQAGLQIARKRLLHALANGGNRSLWRQRPGRRTKTLTGGNGADT
ncbi:hypothetical protein D3C87_1957370 [compost metagenome]